MRIYLIRHSRPDIAEGTFYGHADVGVTEPEFANTVSEINQKTKIQNLKHIYTSPLKRCYSLAQTLDAGYAEIHSDKRIMELNFGDWERSKWDKVDPKALEDWINDYVNSPTPGGESYLDLYNRVSEFWDELIKHTEGPLAVVTHGGVIKCILSRILESPLKKSYAIKVHYGALISVRFFGEDQYEIEFLTTPG